MDINIFVSMGFKNKSTEEILRYLKFTEQFYRHNTEYITDEDNINVFCNYYDDEHKPEYVDDKKSNKKLNDLSRALSIMANCDVFVLYTNPNGSVPFGCNIEMMAWINSGNVINNRTPIILNSGLLNVHEKEK